ncbi:myrosinase 1 isoform X2 [Cryptotermes secundus]|uniref:myrosinase 1 isoform X2 n=1 Tax=Cryptotermes secundus TaxID=105785 RepID=UPI000CD7BF40|nr:myrosinase 1 isoform X2 [Cryptotermes secundus]XP_023717246.1 myrosinase 1 isoform X2 [Cryptotermes secundus]XP_023717247.1 myrosinase 1 isoform X2 [Cryptotermes secundus]
MPGLLWYVGALLAWVNGRPPKDISTLAVPKNFMLGTATSAYQVEGAWNESGKGLSIWDTYVHEHPEFIVDGSNGDVAADSYHQYKQDVAALKHLGVDFYRFSISWSRILPYGHVNTVNEAGIEYYNSLINELKSNKIEPMVAMYHWDLPQALQDLGGWANPVMAEYFEDYARMLFHKFGDRVKWWITFVEPDSIAKGYIPSWKKAPGVNSSHVGLYLAIHTLIKSHSRTYHLYSNEFRDTQKGKVGISLNSRWYEPETESAADIEAAEKAIQYQFGLFANPIYSPEGDYPLIISKELEKLSIAQGYPSSRLRKFTPEEVISVKGTHDFLGLNYYTARIARAPEAVTDINSVADNNVILRTDPRWPASASAHLKVVPLGFRKLLNWIKRAYNNTPVLITENGFSDRGEIEDINRIKYITSHMSQVIKAINTDGCNVIGYTVWSLLDNFEWDKGYTERFGLYQVNFSDPSRHRVPKLSAHVFSEITEKRQVPLCVHGCPMEMRSHSSAVSFNRIFISTYMLIMTYMRFIFLP